VVCTVGNGIYAQQQRENAVTDVVP
jgi:hypothetical protein